MDFTFSLASISGVFEKKDTCPYFTILLSDKLTNENLRVYNIVKEYKIQINCEDNNSDYLYYDLVL